MAVLADLIPGTAVCTPNTQTAAILLATLTCVAIGWVYAVASTLTTIFVANQQDIGVANGLGISLKTLLGTSCVSIYESILVHKMQTAVSEYVVPAVLKAGLPESSLAAYLTALNAGTTSALETVPGINSMIITVGRAAIKPATIEASRPVFLASIAFGIIAILLAVFVPNVEELMTKDVAVTLHSWGSEKLICEWEEDEVALTQFTKVA